VFRHVLLCKPTFFIQSDSPSFTYPLQ
jgi:hypothetical protein